MTAQMELPPLPVEKPEPEISSCSQEWMAKQPLSWWLKAALADLRACEVDPQYAVYMCTWHKPLKLFTWDGIVSPPESLGSLPKETCCVCLAGSMIAKRLGADPTRYVDPCFYHQVALQLTALDHLRRGYVGTAVRTVYGESSAESTRILLSGEQTVYPFVQYDRGNTAPFYAFMERVLHILEKYEL